MRNIHSTKERNHFKAFLLTCGIYALLLLICFLFTFTNNPPLVETEEKSSGILVNYGTSDEGMGNNYKNQHEVSTESVSKKAAVSKPAAASVAQPSASNTPKQQAVRAETPVPVLTSSSVDAEDVVAVSEPVEVVPAVVPEPEPEPVLNTNALYKGGSKSTVKTVSEGDGTANIAGNQGVKHGDLYTRNYEGKGGSGGVSLDLAGRSFKNRPILENNGQYAGKVVVEIVVNLAGTIISAKAGARGTTISDMNLWKKCEQAVLLCKISEIDAGPEVEMGRVVFSFKLE